MNIKNKQNIDENKTQNHNNHTKSKQITRDSSTFKESKYIIYNKTQALKYEQIETRAMITNNKYDTNKTEQTSKHNGVKEETTTT